MDIYTIPVADDAYIVYRPLRQLAFVGNRTMAERTLALAAAGPGAPASAGDELAFLERLGFLGPETPPAPPERDFAPTTAVLLLTNRCQLRCVYCYANAGTGVAQQLSIETARAAVDYVCDRAAERGQGRFELTFHGGGEPSLAWDAVTQATAYARAKPLPCRVSMVSNGVWSPRQREWVVANLDSLSLSIDGRPATQDRQRPLLSGRGSSAAVLRTIRELDRLGFSYGIRMTAIHPWRDQLADDVRWLCNETGCRSFQVEPAYNTARGGHRWPAPEECAAFAEGFMSAYEIARAAGRTLYYSGARPWLRTASFCGASYNALIVVPSGDIVTCYEVSAPDHPLAHVSRIGRVEAGRVVVDDAARGRLLARIAERREQCRDCFCYWHCAGDCYVQTFGDAPDSHLTFSRRCVANRTITAQLLLWNLMASDGVWRGDELSPCG